MQSRLQLDPIYQPLMKFMHTLEGIIKTASQNQPVPFKEDKVALINKIKNLVEVYTQSPDKIARQDVREKLTDIEAALQLIIKKLKNDSNGADKNISQNNTNQIVMLDRFDRGNEGIIQDTLTEYEKLHRMVRFFNVAKDKKIVGFSRSFGESYGNLFKKDQGGKTQVLAQHAKLQDDFFFTLTEKGYQVYHADMQSLKEFKMMLEDFNFNYIEITTEAAPPKTPGFQQHKQYLTIPHAKIGLLICLHFWTNDPRRILKTIYENAKDDYQKPLNALKCRLYENHIKVFNEADADYYGAYLLKVAGALSAHRHTHNKIINGLLQCVSQKNIQHPDPLDHRHYLDILFNLQHDYNNLSDAEKQSLPFPIQAVLSGLPSILIMGETDESAGISRRLGRHFGQLYELTLPSEPLPFVQFTKEGCCFYFTVPACAQLIHAQLHAHQIACQVIDGQSRLPSEPTEKEYPYKLVVTPMYHYQLLCLARFHPANIEVALTQAYENQKLNYTSSFLHSLSEQTGAPQLTSLSSTPAITPAYAVVQLKDGRQVVQLSVKAPAPKQQDDMGHVVILLDDSGSMGTDKMKAANQACVNIIKNLPRKTKITLQPFNKAPIFAQCEREKLPEDWEEKILAVKATGGTPLIEKIVQAAANIMPKRCFTPVSAVKKSTFLLLTDGEGDHGESAADILTAVETGVYQGKDISLCNHGLGTKELPNKTIFPIVPIGIGNTYDKEVIGGLKYFAGFYHIREDKNLINDLEGMTKSIKTTFGYKTGPIHIGLFQSDHAPVLTTRIDMMLPNTQRKMYAATVNASCFDKLKLVMSVEGVVHSTLLSVNKEISREEILLGYFQSQLDGLIETFAGEAAQLNNPCYGSMQARGAPVLFVNSNNALEKTRKETLAALQALLSQIKDNLTDSESKALVNQICCSQGIVQNYSVSNQNDLRRMYADTTRRMLGRDDTEDNLDNNHLQYTNSKFG